MRTYQIFHNKVPLVSFIWLDSPKAFGYDQTVAHSCWSQLRLYEHISRRRNIWPGVCWQRAEHLGSHPLNLSPRSPASGRSFMGFLVNGSIAAATTIVQSLIARMGIPQKGRGTKSNHRILKEVKSDAKSFCLIHRKHRFLQPTSQCPARHHKYHKHLTLW